MRFEPDVPDGARRLGPHEASGRALARRVARHARVESEGARTAHRGRVTAERHGPVLDRRQTPCAGAVVQDGLAEVRDGGRRPEEARVACDPIQDEGVVVVDLARDGGLRGERLPVSRSGLSVAKRYPTRR
jgi:hypothetical protein